MLQARPLYDTGPDEALFVAPEVWDRLRSAVRQRFNVALVGARGSGKTTVLRQLQRELRVAGTRVTFVDAAGAVDLGALVAAIETELAPREEDRAGLVSPGSASLQVVQRIRALAEQPDAVVLVDCSHAGNAAHELFGRMRDELWQMGHRWVVAIDESDRSVALAPPADAFFDQVLAIEMDQRRLLEMLERRDTGLDTGSLRRIVERASTPRAALQTVRDARLSPDADPLEANLWRQEGAKALGRPHSMAMHELEELGGASASDAEFLRRLGWTRARASQVLGDLADADLVVAADERTPGAGRPRRVYRPAEVRES